MESQPAPKVESQPAPPLTWPLKIGRIHLVWSRTGDLLPALAPCVKQPINVRVADGMVMTKADPEAAIVTVETLNAQMPLEMDPAAVDALVRSAKACLDTYGLLGTRARVRLLPSSKRGAPPSLYLLMDVPLPDMTPRTDLPKLLMPLPPPPNQDDAR